MRKRIQKNEESGFTLIELLIVIIILGILAAIVVFAVGSTRKDAVSSSCKTDYKSIELSAEAVNTKTGKYPAAQADVYDSTKGGLLKNWPGGTSTANDDYVFTYSQTGSGSGFSVVIAGKNVDGGTLTNGSTNAALETACKDA